MIAKTPEELEILRAGGRRLAQHVKALSEMVRPGVAASDLEKEARERVKNDGDEMAFFGYKGGGKHGFPSGVCVSVNDVIVHSPAGENGAVFAEGDIVCVDFGIKHKGLFTDHAVTVFAGGPKDTEEEKLVNGTREALAVGIAQACVGNTVGDIGHAVEEVADTYGFGFPRNLSGHGVGRAVHEEPHVPNFGDPGTGEGLVEGLVIAIEPMMTLGSGELLVDKDGHSFRTRDGSRTAHFEHTVLITKNGPEILTEE